MAAKKPPQRPRSVRASTPPQNLFWAGTALALLVAVSYAWMLRADFIWDDDVYVTQNATLRSPEGLRRIWTEIGAVPQYYPLVHTTFWIEYRLWGLSAAGYHAVNIALHAASVIVLWRLLARLKVPGAWLAAALFAVHPVEVESVAWITERKNVLSLLLALLSLSAYLRFDPLEDKAVPDEAAVADKSRGRWYAVSLLLFCAAMLSKTVVATLPAVILVITWWKQGRVSGRDVSRLVPFFAVAVSLGLLTVWMEKSVVGAVGEEWALSPLDRVLLAGRALWFYAGKLVWPYPLAFFYPRFAIDDHVWWQYLFPLAALGVVAALWHWRTRLGRGPLAAVLIFAGVLTPALGFFDVYPFRFSYVADHFQYHAGIALLALAGAGLTRLLATPDSQGQRLGKLLMAALIGGLAALTFCQTFIYYDLETLYADTIDKNPQSWIAYANLSMHYITIGRKREAYALAERAVEIAPEDSLTNGNLGALILADALTTNDQQKIDSAISYFQKSIELNADNVAAHKGLAYALMLAGRMREAETQVAPVLQLSPNDANALFVLGKIRLHDQQWDAARDCFEQSLRGNPEDVETMEALALTLKQLGKDQAADQLRQRVATRRLQRALVARELGKQHLLRGNYEQAIARLQESLRLEPGNTTAKESLQQALDADQRQEK